MKITGHKTNSMYRRYLIVDEDDTQASPRAAAGFPKESASNKEGCPAQDGNRKLNQCSHGQ